MKVSIAKTIDVDRLANKIKSVQSTNFIRHNEGEAYVIPVKKVTYLIMTKNTLDALEAYENQEFVLLPKRTPYFMGIPIAVCNNCGLEFGEVDICYEI